MLELLSNGYNNTEIAEILFISSHTSKAHVQSILHKLHAKNRTEAAYITGQVTIISKYLPDKLNELYPKYQEIFGDKRF